MKPKSACCRLVVGVSALVLSLAACDRPPIAADAPSAAPPAAPPAANQLFYEDFEGVELPAWEPNAGEWEVRDLPGGGKQYSAARKQHALSVAGNGNWKDYVVDARVTIQDDRFGPVGIAGRVQDSHFYYELLLGRNDAGKKGWFLRQRLRHAWTNLAAGPYEYELGVPYTLRLAIKGQRLEASVSPNGRRSFVILGAADSKGTALTQGKVGAVGYGGLANWDDFRVTGDFLYDAANPWGPLIEIRDTSGFFSGAPAGGWYVAAIHGTLRPSDGRVVISGYSRKGVASCTSGTNSSQNGTSWILDPNTANPPTLFIQPINEQPLVSPDDVVYCAGHVTLPGGRVFFSGGSRHPGGFPFSSERGLNYGRVFNFDTNSFTRISVAAKGGTVELPGEKWYPTSILMPDGNTLTFGGFTFNSGGTGPRKNQSLELFDPATWDANQAADPWTVLTTHAEGQPDTVPTRGYTNLFLLPKPIPALNGGGFARTVALSGGVGRVFLFNHEPGPGGPARLLAKANALTPNMSGTEKGEGASGVVLPDGRLMYVNGGHLGTDSAKVYFYNPTTDAWNSQTTLSNSRIYGDAVWLPDGRVMIINGYVSEPGNTNDVTDPLGDVRVPEIIDPWTNPPTVTQADIWPDAFWRGYHSIAVVLKDARILVAAGKDDTHATGCEKSNMRIYEPPYLFGAGGRPTITNLPEGVPMTVGGAALTVAYTGTVRSTRGVALMAPGSLTHGFDMGQRYVPLAFTDNGDGTLTVQPPENINIAPPGEYLLYLVSNTGVPSLGKYVQLAPPPMCRYAVNGTGDSYIEAEARSRQSGPFAAVSDATRSGGAYLGVTEGSGSHTTEPDEGKVLWYDVTVSNGGTFNLWALANGPDTNSDTFWASVDGMPDVQLTLPAVSWGWVAASGTLNLPNGKHTIKIKVREDGSLIDKILLTKLGTTPTGLGGTALTCTGPSAPGAPTAMPGDKQVALSWNAVAGATGYTVKRSTTSGGNYLMVQSNISGTSFTNFGLQNGTQYFFVVSASNAAAESPNSPQASATPAAPPAPTWTDADIGTVGVAGSSTINGGTITVRGAGADITGTADAFHFLYQTMTGNGSITARITGITGGDGTNTAKVGVMMRDPGADGQGANDVNAFAMIKPAAAQNKFQRRLTSGTTTVSTTITPGTATPTWVRLTRTGNTLLGEQSLNGSTWTTLGSDTVTMATTIRVGLAVTSHNTTLLTNAVFDSITVSGAAMNAAPTVATAAAATPSPAPGTTTALSVLGADDAGEAALSYTWSTTGSPPAPVTFSANGTNAAKNTTATFTKAGSYAFQVVIRDAGNLTVTSSVSLTVSQTLTSIVVAPASANVSANGTQQFTATARDQFATALSSQPGFTWMVSGGGTISAGGLFTAGATAGGPFTVTAASGAINGTAQVTVTVPNEPPVVATPAAASPDPATGTTTALSVLGADDGGEAALTYTWSTTGSPPAAVNFSANGTNAAKNATATFTKAGSYNFQVVVRDSGGLTATSAVTMSVSQTLTSIVVTPASASVGPNATQQFSSTARDQFATALISQPSFSWMVSGGGTISTGGLFTAGATPGGPFTVTATSGAINGTAQVTVTAGPAAPSNLGATITGGNQANLTWTDNSTNETGFRVERKVGTGSFTTLATKAANTTSHPDPGLAANTTYTYRVIATGTPDSTPSNEVVVVIRNNSADAHVRDGTNVNNNYGANTTIEAKNNATVGNNRQAFVKFSIADVAATVTSAKIRLFGASVTSTKSIAVSAVSDTTWVEGTGTIAAPVTATGIDWTTKPAIGSQLSSLSVTTTAGYWEFDITSHVQARKTAGATQVSLAITMVTSSGESPTSFNTKENAANKPVVVIASKP